MTRPRVRSVLRGASAGAAPPRAATAQEPPPAAEPAARKAEGDQAMEALRYADALAAYRDAYALTKDPALLYNMGRALQALNRFPEALEKLEAFQAAASPELLGRVPRLPALIAEIRARVSTVTITTNVDGARILVRGTVAGKAPLERPLKLTSGRAEIDVEADGYFPARHVIDLPGGDTTSLDVPLYSRSTTGILSVRSTAARAEVFVDAKRVGVAPVEVNLPGGNHAIRLTHPDFSDLETTAVVPAGGRKELNLTLSPPSITSRWWFWGGVGVAVAAGVAVAIVATTERSPDSGTIAPGQLPAPGGAAFRF